MRRTSFLAGILIALLAVSLSGLMVSAAEGERSSETPYAELPRLEDYADQTYMITVYRDLEKRVPVEPDFAKDWAIARFAMDRKGKIERAEISNSTGNEKFNVEVLKILHETHLPPLPEDCPDKVKATHAFNYRRATKGLPSTKTAVGDANKSEEAKQLFKGFGLHQSDGSTVTTNDTANREAVKKIASNSLFLGCYAVFMIMVMGGGSIFAFFIALPVWYLHRLFFGRFPA